MGKDMEKQAGVIVFLGFVDACAKRTLPDFLTTPDPFVRRR
jgi:hypothetical protein